MDVSALFNAMPGAIARSDLGIMAIACTLRSGFLDIADLSVDGTMCTGAAYVLC